MAQIAQDASALFFVKIPMAWVDFMSGDKPIEHGGS